MDVTFLSDLDLDFLNPPVHKKSPPTHFLANTTKCSHLFLATDDNHKCHHDNNNDVTINDVTNVNATSSTSQSMERDEDLARIEVTVLAVIFCMAIIGNSMVLFALQFRKKKTSRMRYFIMHLTVADLLVAFCNILPQLAWDITFRFQGNDFMCRLVAFLQVVVIYASTYLLVLTSVDRYRAICHPLTFNKWTRKRCRNAVILVWGLSIFFASPQVFIWRLTEISPGVYDCYSHFNPEWTVVAYVTIFGISIYLLPLCLMTFFYGRICYEICRNFFHDRGFKSRNSGDLRGSTGIVYKFNGTGHISIIGSKHTSQNGGPQQNGCTNQMTSSSSRDVRRHQSLKAISRSKMKTVKLTFVVVVAYLICWSPYMIANMWWAYDPKAPITNGIFVICVLLAGFNACVNPWIYMSFSGNLMRQIFPCFRRKKPKLRERVRSVDDVQQRQDNAGGAQEKLLDRQPNKVGGTQKKNKKNKSHNQQKQQRANSTSQKRGGGFLSLKNTLFSTRSQPTKLTGTSDTAKSRYAVGGGGAKYVVGGEKFLASPQGEGHNGQHSGYLLQGAGHQNGAAACNGGVYKNNVRNTCV